MIMFTKINALSKFLTLFVLFFPLSAFATIKVVDFENHELVFDKPVERIVALAPHIVENVFTAHAGDKLVAAVSYSDFPEEAKKLPIVGGYHSLSVEKILALKPDVVLAWRSGNDSDALQKLSQLKIPVYFGEPKTTDDVARAIRDIAIMAGTLKEAEVEIDRFLDDVSQLKDAYSKKEKVKVFYQVWDDPLQTLSGKSLINNVIEICGGINIYKAEPVIAPIVSVESVIERNPHMIFGGGMNVAEKNWSNIWLKWQSIFAVKNQHLYYVHPDLLHRHTVRIAQGAKQTCEHMEKVRKVIQKNEAAQ